MLLFFVRKVVMKCFVERILQFKSACFEMLVLKNCVGV